MHDSQFDRFAVKMEPLANRKNKKFIDRGHVDPNTVPPPLPADAAHRMDEVALTCSRVHVPFSFSATPKQ